MDIREFQELLGDMLDELPEPFFDELNGGVIVSPRAKENPHSQGGDLYILGEYHRSSRYGQPDCDILWFFYAAVWQCAGAKAGR